MKDDPAHKKLVKKATKMLNPLKTTGCEPEEMKTIDGEPLTLESYWATNLHPVQFLWIFELFNDNMLEMYKRSNWGYEEESKKQELQATTARYIIVKDSKKKHVGYVHYRFVVDYGFPAVYCFELQIAPAYQKRGVGSLLIDILVNLAKKTGMHKVMATVFMFNYESLAFFHKNGFRLDASTPTATDCDYFILSRNVLPGKEPIINKENSAASAATIENDDILGKMIKARYNPAENAAMEDDIIAQLINSKINPKKDDEVVDTSKSIILKASAEAKKKNSASKTVDDAGKK
uniref:N-alpha-acetyltransferase 40 n=1 Tax=Panagrolaimus sp. ES5 TaxID=591445 RepID=A0AC34GXE1_9BILA